MKTIKLEGDALEHARELVSLHAELADKKRVIETEAMARWAAVQEEYDTATKAAWASITATTGIQDLTCWDLVTQFLDEHGLAFLVLNEDRFRLQAEMQRRLGMDEPNA